MELRAYQKTLYNDIRHELAVGKKSVCAVLGCGGGKSCIEAAIAKSATDRGNRVLFIVHRAELCGQIVRTFTEWDVDMSLCVVAMVQTVTRHLDRQPEPRLIITDECHHGLSKSYTNIYEYFPSATRIGFTATPARMNEGGLGEIFDALVEGPSTKWLIENGYLARYRYYSYSLADTSGLHVKRGDYVPGEIAALMERSVIYGDTIANWQRFSGGGQTIIYCASIAASKATALSFSESGVPSAHLDGETPREERDRTVEDFRNGKITVLCNVDLFGEGFDCPDCECVILLRPTKSLTLFIQQSMRSMRPKDGKTAIIIDHVRNVYEHGFPDDAREWTLDSKKRHEKGDIRIRECPHCFAVMPSGAAVCPVCGYAFAVEDHTAELEEHPEAELQDITGDDINGKTYSGYKDCSTFKELGEFQKKRGYKFGWVIHKAKELGIEIPPKYRYYAERVMSYRKANA